MRKSATLLATGVALGLATMPVLGQQTRSTTQNSFIDYIGAQLAISDVDGFDNGLALVVTGGKELPAAPGLSVEGEVTTTITKPEADLGGVSADVSYWTLAGYGAYTFPLSQQVGLRGRVGVLYENLEIDATGTSGDSDDEFGLSVGVGATFRINPRLNAIAEYTRIEEDINHLSAGVQFLF